VRIVWSAESVEDLAALRAFIAADSPGAAKKMIRRIAETVETLLPQNPEIDSRKTPKLGGEGERRGRANWSSRARRLSLDIAFTTKRSKSCAFSTARGAGPIGYKPQGTRR
jgi:plasmid stabilization system protein ParE